ncbi:MAG: nodulation protein NfeD [Gemmatimonadota bacterium]
MRDNRPVARALGWASFLFVTLAAQHGREPPERAFVSRVVIDGAIQPASAEFLVDAIESAAEAGAAALVIELDTPGGLVDSTRDIVQAMLASAVPIIVYVAPSGARAGSAGVFLTLAAHVAAMAPGTNIGAATPVALEGDLDRKVLNDTVAFARALATRRGRNAEWAEQAVREAAALTEVEALAADVIDVVAPTLPLLLAEVDGRMVDVAGRPVALATAGAEVRTVTKGWRFRVLDTIANPNVAFLLMLIGIYGIIFELMNPGAILPGVVGGISILLAFFALQTLPVSAAGVLLILFAIVLFIAEIKVLSHGLLSVGGVVAFVLGATMLFDAPEPFFRVSWSVILPAALLTAAFFAFVVGMAYRTWRTRPTTGREGLVGERGVVRRRIDPATLEPAGQIQVRGELWRARAEEPLEVGTAVEVVGADGLTLTVRRAE